MHVSRWLLLLVAGLMPVAQAGNGGQEAKASPVQGVWLGTLTTPGGSLRIQVHVKSDASGKLTCEIDSVDQGAMGNPCENVRLEGNKFSFDVPVVHGNWSGTLSDDGNELNGTWTQGGGLPLVLKRQAAPVAPEKPKPPKYDPAMAPVSGEQIKTVLDRDLADALKSGPLSPETHGAVVVGIIDHGKRQIFAYGGAKEDAIFEIGSISKTFTGLILAQMVEQHKVTLDQPVRELLPQGTVAKPSGREITLVDLATQHSGLPRMPDNFQPTNRDDPYADYGSKNLYEYVAKHGVSRPEQTTFEYSNLGFGLLGQALSSREAVSYPELLQREVTGPLGMNDTVVNLSAEQKSRFEQGHDAQHREAHPWNLDAFAGAGAIRSTASDMLKYLEAQLHPDRAGRGSGGNSDSPSATMGRAIELSHELRSEAFPGMRVALAWLYIEETGTYWHNGGTGGFNTYAFFNPKQDCAAVVLFNTTVLSNGGFADRLGQHIAQRLSGKPAVTLGD